MLLFTAKSLYSQVFILFQKETTVKCKVNGFNPHRLNDDSAEVDEWFKSVHQEPVHSNLSKRLF